MYLLIALLYCFYYDLHLMMHFMLLIVNTILKYTYS